MDVSLIELLERMGPPWNFLLVAALFITSCYGLWKVVSYSILWCYHVGWPKLKWRIKGPFPIIAWHELAKMEEYGWDVEELPGNYKHYWRINGQLYKMDCMPKYMLSRNIKGGAKYNMITFYRPCETIEPVEMYQIRCFTANPYQHNYPDTWAIYFAPWAHFGEPYQISGLAESIGEDDRAFFRRMARRSATYDYSLRCFLLPDEARAKRLLTFLENRYIMRQLVTGGRGII